MGGEGGWTEGRTLGMGRGGFGTADCKHAAIDTAQKSVCQLSPLMSMKPSRAPPPMNPICDRCTLRTLVGDFDGFGVVGPYPRPDHWVLMRGTAEAESPAGCPAGDLVHHLVQDLNLPHITLTSLRRHPTNYCNSSTACCRNPRPLSYVVICLQ